MINWIFVSFAFGAGLAAFFSPCSVALLPGYVTYYLSKNSAKWRVFSSVFFAFEAILGFFFVFGSAGTLLLLIGQQVKTLIPSISVFSGFFLVFVGTNLLRGRDVLNSLMRYFKMSKKDQSGFLFGVMYAVGALSCTFPLFISVVIAGIIDNSVFSSFGSLLSYIVGFSLLMLIITIGVGFARDFFQRNILKALPFVNKISAFLILFAGFYMIYYQLAFV